MEQYIKKADIVAEIERLKNIYDDDEDIRNVSKYNILVDILSFLDTIEVEEVDLEQEIQQHINDCLDIKFQTTDIKMIAKNVEYTARKFFELGLGTQLPVFIHKPSPKKLASELGLKTQKGE